MHVLEIGGGNGYQANLMASYGCVVSSIDLATRKKPQRSHFPVQSYDGNQIPFDAASFDLVFSSNVLEHVQDLSALLLEMRRVLKIGGTMIHILPSTVWRFWTSLAHYVYVPLFFLGRRSRATGLVQVPVHGLKTQHSYPFLIKTALWAGPHGEYPNALSELYYFSKRRWQRLFKNNHCEVEALFSNALFYTGYCLFPDLSLGIRKKLAHFLGAACHIFVIHPGLPG